MSCFAADLGEIFPMFKPIPLTNTILPSHCRMIDSPLINIYALMNVVSLLQTDDNGQPTGPYGLRLPLDEKKIQELSEDKFQALNPKNMDKNSKEEFTFQAMKLAMNVIKNRKMAGDISKAPEGPPRVPTLQHYDYMYDEWMKLAKKTDRRK